MPRDPYRGTVPTRPKQVAQRTEPRAEYDPEITKVRCPTCAGVGFITVEQFIALEDDAKRRENLK